MESIHLHKTKLDDKIESYLKKQIDDNFIDKARVTIREALNVNVDKFRLSETIIKRLFILFDKFYFKGLIQKKLNYYDIELEFSISNTMKRTAGCVKYHKHKLELAFSAYIINKIYAETFNSIRISGIICYDIIDVLIVLMEHEITHLILSIYFGYKNDVKSGHNSQFKTLVWNMYRHTKITHDLLIGDIETYKKHQDTAHKELRIGMTIKCGKHSGTVINIKPNFILYKTDNDVKGCKFNEYTILDSEYEAYQEKRQRLKDQLKIGVQVRCKQYYGPITKIKHDRVYFQDENTSKTIWCLIDFLELLR